MECHQSLNVLCALLMYKNQHQATKTHDNTVYLLQFVHKGFNFSNPSSRLLSVILKYSLWFLALVRVGNGDERPNLDQTRPDQRSSCIDVMEVCHLLHKTIAILLHCTLGPQTPALVSLSVLV